MVNNLIMISAMYENGGNVFHRHLDGHPELYVYPFESQLGTRYVNDELLSFYPFKYRWPLFPLEGKIEDDFELFFDEEIKTRLRRPDGSKFRNADIEMNEKERKSLFIKYMNDKPRTTGNLVMAFFYATFEAWKNYKKTNKEKYYVGYSPIVGVDAERIFSDLPNSYIIHIVRHPCACYSETKRRPFPLSLKRYTWTWNITQYKALVYKEMYPDKFIIIKYEDLLTKKREVMEKFSQQVGISFDESLLYPSWNGQKLEDVYPWGTINIPDVNEQETRKQELSKQEISEIELISKIFLQELGY